MGEETQSEALEFTARDFIEEFFKIRDKNSNLVNLKFNHAQEKFYDLLKDSYGSKPSRYIVLKARQLGISTFTEAFIFYATIFTPNTSSVLLAHQSDSASAIFNMTKLFYDELPDMMKPERKYSNAKELVFDNESGTGLKSSIRVMVASDATRGSTYKYAHLSEVAFWEHPEEALLALNQAIPSTDDSLIVIESTANGFNYFYTLWQDAVNGRNDYTPIFFPWYLDPNYTRKYDGFVLTSYEKDIMERYNLTLDQLQWRRWCIANNCGNDELKFRQEYPITPEEAFITSGTSIFNSEIILQHMKNLEEPLRRGYFSYDYDGLHLTNIKWVNDSSGYIKIYKEPSWSSVIGGDTAGEGSDFFAAQVLDQNGQLCATLHKQFDADLFVKQVYCLGAYYHSLIAIESNFDTFPNRELQRLRYPTLYVRENFDSIAYDVQEKYGFKTTVLTRPQIISELVEIAREHIEKITDRETLQEMLSFVRNKKGRAEAAEGAHDDLVMSLAIAYHALGQLPNRKPIIREERMDEDLEFFNY